MAKVEVEVCYARPDKVFRQILVLPSGSTIGAAIACSSLLMDAPEIDVETARVGIFGKLKPLDTVLRERDRIEIYRPLIADPKEARRSRAARKRARGEA